MAKHVADQKGAVLRRDGAVGLHAVSERPPIPVGGHDDQPAAGAGLPVQSPAAGFLKNMLEK